MLESRFVLGSIRLLCTTVLLVFLDARALTAALSPLQLIADELSL